MNELGKKLLIFLFIGYICGISIVFLIIPDKEKSVFENRNLKQHPSLNVRSVMSGDYMHEFEEYFTDQFPSRTRWFTAFISYELLSGKTYLFDHYIDNDHWILPRPNYEFPKKSIKRAAEKVNEFANYLKEKDIEAYFFLTPTKTLVLSDILPNYIEEGADKEKSDYFISHIDDQKVVLGNLGENFLNHYDFESLKDMYFKTDHHWNIHGAFEGYKDMIDLLEENSKHIYIDKEWLNRDYYDYRCLDSASYDFVGSSNRNLFMTVTTEDDDQILCSYFNDEIFDHYEVTNDKGKVDFYDVFNRSFKSDASSVTYSKLFSSDHREINIYNPNLEDNGGKVLIIKDSFLNPMAALIAQHFYQTTIYDPRHNQDRTIVSFIEENDFDLVMIVYNSGHITGNNYNFFDLPL